MWMDFMKQRLDYHPQDQQNAIDLLRRTVADYLPDFMKASSAKP